VDLGLAYAAHRFEPALIRIEDCSRITAEFLEEAIQSDRSNIRQVIQNHERLTLR
jgi:hypothetical protein